MCLIVLSSSIAAQHMHEVPMEARRGRCEVNTGPLQGQPGLSTNAELWSSCSACLTRDILHFSCCTQHAAVQTEAHRAFPDALGCEIPPGIQRERKLCSGTWQVFGKDHWLISGIVSYVLKANLANS